MDIKNIKLDIKDIYKQIASDNNSFLLNLNIEDFYTSMLTFDPVTNESFYSNWDELLYNVSRYDFSKYSLFNDRFYNIVKFSEQAIYQIIDLLHEKNIREYKITNPNIIKDIDTKCMIWLNKKPGFNIKQKIASNQKMMGVFHKTSIDTAENRLFKAFLIKLDDIFAEKEKILKKYYPKDQDDKIINTENLFLRIYRWIYSEEAQLISNWNNIPPNNTLLNDKNYRKIWKSWNFLQHINDEIKDDFNNKQYLLSEIAFVLLLSKLNCDNRFQLKQDIVCPNYHINRNYKLTFFKDNNPIIKGYYLNNSQYNKLTLTLNNNLIKIQINNGIKDPLDITLKNIESFSQINDIVNKFLKKIFGEIKNNRVFNSQEVKEKQDLVAVLDVDSILPEYVVEGKETKRFTEKLICQSVSDKKYNLPCNCSKYIETKNNNYRTYSIHHIFNLELGDSLSKNKELLTEFESASYKFANIIAKVLNTNKCVYLVPDKIEDFSPVVSTFKRSMHTSFVEALLLPRSVASIFSNYEQILSRIYKGREIKIEDIYDSYKIEIIYKVKEDKNLKNILPKTKGFVFERKSVEIKNIKKSFVVSENIKNIIYNKDIKLLNNKFSIDDFHFNNKTIENENYIGVFINNSKVDNIVEGALKLYTLQKEVNCNNKTNSIISLWKDYLPPLSIEQDDKSKFPLVGENVSINPFLNVSQNIPIKRNFELPENKPEYEFPLIQGEGKEKIKYFACIKDDSFPLREPIKCKLKLTYTYGKSTPYELEFLPIDRANFKTFKVNWEHESHRDLIHLPYPEYPEKKSWGDMKNFASEGKVINFIDDWLIKDIDKIQNKGEICEFINLKKDKNEYYKDKKGCEYLLYFCKGSVSGKKFYCRIEKNIHEEILKQVEDYNKINIWCYINPYKYRYQGYQGDFPLVIAPNISRQRFLSGLKRGIKTVWKDSKSIYDEDCPDEFRKKIQKFIKFLSEQTELDISKKVKNEYWTILSCLAQDVPEKIVKKYIKEVISDDEKLKESKDNLGYILAVNSEDELLNIILNNWLLDEKKRKIAAMILNIALWKNKELVYNISSSIDELIKYILIICSQKNINNDRNCIKREISNAIELLLAILRLRETKDDNLCKKLSPAFNPAMKEIQIKLERLKNIIKKEKYKLISYRKFDIKKKEEKDIPDILYVADLYIDGKVESNSIKILNDIEEDYEQY